MPGIFLEDLSAIRTRRKVLFFARGKAPFATFLFLQFPGRGVYYGQQRKKIEKGAERSWENRM